MAYIDRAVPRSGKVGFVMRDNRGVVICTLYVERRGLCAFRGSSNLIRYEKKDVDAKASQDGQYEEQSP